MAWGGLERKNKQQMQKKKNNFVDEENICSDVKYKNKKNKKNVNKNKGEKKLTGDVLLWEIKVIEKIYMKLNMLWKKGLFFFYFKMLKEFLYNFFRLADFYFMGVMGIFVSSKINSEVLKPRNFIILKLKIQNIVGEACFLKSLLQTRLV